MSSSQWANFSNTTSALKGSLGEGASVDEGEERENDKKAFLAEMAQNSSQYTKEKAFEQAGKSFAGTKVGGRIVKRVTGKSATPLTDEANAQRATLETVMAGGDEEGLAFKAVDTEAGNLVSSATDVRDTAVAAKTAAETASTEAQAGIQAATAAEDAEVVASRAALEQIQSVSATTVGTTPISRGLEQAATQRVADAEEAQGSAVTRAANLATEFETRSTAAGDAEEALTTARTTQQAGQAAEDVARAARVVKVTKDVEEADKVAAASEESGDPIAMIVGGIAAAITGIVGSRMKVHSVVAPPAPNIAERASYGAVAGA